MHCFNKYENQKICPDFEVSYLIECKQPLEQNPIRNQRRHQQNKLSCAINNTNATVPTILISTSPTMLSSTSLTSNGRATSIKFMYLMIIFVGLLTWNYFCEINMPRFLLPTYIFWNSDWKETACEILCFVNLFLQSYFIKSSYKQLAWSTNRIVWWITVLLWYQLKKT